MLLGVRSGGEDVFQLHPLGRKRIEEPFHLWIGQHAVDGFLQYLGLGQFVALGKLKQFSVRTAGPQKKREVGGESEGALLRGGGLVVVQEQRRGQGGRGDLLHRVGERHLLFHLAERVGGVALQRGRLHLAAEGMPQEPGNALARFGGQISTFGGGLEERVPDANGVFVEVRAFDDRNAQAKKGIEQQRREGQLISLIIEPVRGAEILRERLHLGQTAAGIECVRAGVHAVRHLGRIQIDGLSSHQFFRKRKHIAVKLKQIAHGIVILETVQSPGRIALGCLAGGGGAEHGLERGEQLGAVGRLELGLVFRRHVAGV